MEKPFAAACARNQDPILEVLRAALAESRSVLEVGSGTGQHAVHFARALSHLTWHTSDLDVNHDGIRAWLDEAALPNTTGPHSLDVGGNWTVPDVDAVFTANTLHIMDWALGKRFLARVGEVLPPNGTLCVYGPFNYNGTYTAPGNAQFDIWLKNNYPSGGIRHFEDVCAEAEAADLTLVTDHAMPANNRLLQFRRR